MRLAVAATGVLLAAGCAHKSAAPANTAAAAPAPVAARAPARRAPPPPAAPVAMQSGKTKEGAIFFDFDSASLRDDARPVLQKVATTARDARAAVRIEGNCDELGTVEYNLALGEQRARAAKEYLVHMGVPANRITTVSWGSQRPKYTGHDDEARAKNRRDDLVLP